MSFERMTLTRDHAPLSGNPPATVNYTLDGPAHRLLLEEFPRRIRAEFGGVTVLDTTRAALLHETGLIPQLYIPEEDVRQDLLAPTDHHTTCPFKGEASYRSVRVGERVAENAVWTYPDPIAEARWLRGRLAFYWHMMDRWLDEDVAVEGHIRDPYTRVDVRPTSRHVEVRVGGVTVAETSRANLLSETSLPNRFYVPPDDVRLDLLSDSDKRTICPYKGTASYWTARIDGRTVEDVAWTYREPFPEVGAIAGQLSFLGDEVETFVDGARL
jgi:uncharacterized protein (DUF427 family)